MNSRITYLPVQMLRATPGIKGTPGEDIEAVVPSCIRLCCAPNRRAGLWRHSAGCQPIQALWVDYGQTIHKI